MNKKRLLLFFVFSTILILLLISCGAMSPEVVTETVEVEVTRVVTETVEVEGEVVEVTVVETVIEEVEVIVEEEAVEEAEEEMDEEMAEEDADEAMDDEDFTEFDESGQDDFGAIGSEGAGDIPPTPEGGPKVEETRTAGDSEQIEISNPDVRAQTDDSSDTTESSPDTTLSQLNQLSAGELDDNAEFEAYLAYLNSYPNDDVLLADISDRIKVSIVDSQTQPIVGATITFVANEEIVTQMTTRSDGSIFFFPNSFANTAVTYTLIIEHENDVLVEDISVNDAQFEWQFSMLNVTVDNTAVALDLLFVIDTTASMRDEINELKENIQFIASQVNNLPASLDIQYGMVTYRDIEDAYITRQTPFTNDINAFADALELVTAGGGGDYPEDLHSALSEGLNNMAWRSDKRIGLIFVVADAPPHLDYGQEEDYLVSIQNANEAGLKIFPIASSGLNEQGEYIFRQLAQMTNGRFVFITDEPTGTTTGDTSASVTTDTAYTVGQLDQLIINIIADEINNLVQN
ncbi:MAG: vWA domain-containing protein [Chloroflexota bacterium]